ncbi:MAG TPA: glucosyl-3-phosphoglycerate synthase [Acidimicrobiales bacterium]|nr:glucosyl-3-phosphoglycerate synthase [Acidimicrobiales bacterium]
MRRSYSWSEFPADRVIPAKRGRKVSVVIPARDEEATVGPIVSCIRRELADDVALVDEILVMDDGSTDRTATVAAEAGATVVSTSDVLPDYAVHGKGQAMWKGVHAATGDVIVFCDADIRDFHAGFILGLAGPLLTRDDITFAKGFYERSGGRVTELMARPLISVFFPHLSDLAQPLSGECGAFREVLESVPFAGGYAVDLGLLIDVTARYGNNGLVQCDLGERVHRNRTLAELGPQALSILQVGLERAGVADEDFPWRASLQRPGGDTVEVAYLELPALTGVPGHRMTA